jgi:hypothetical protein
VKATALGEAVASITCPRRGPHTLWFTSSHEAFAALCSKIVQGLSADKDAELSASASECLGTEGCEAFVPCAVPINLIRWSE